MRQIDIFSKVQYHPKVPNLFRIHWLEDESKRLSIYSIVVKKKNLTKTTKEDISEQKKHCFDGCVPLNVFFAVKIVPMSWSMFCRKKPQAKTPHQSLCSVFLKIISDVANHAFQISVRFMSAMVCLRLWLACRSYHFLFRLFTAFFFMKKYWKFTERVTLPCTYPVLFLWETINLKNTVHNSFLSSSL